MTVCEVCEQIFQKVIVILRDGSRQPRLVCDSCLIPSVGRRIYYYSCCNNVGGCENDAVNCQWFRRDGTKDRDASPCRCSSWTHCRGRYVHLRHTKNPISFLSGVLGLPSPSKTLLVGTIMVAKKPLIIHRRTRRRRAKALRPYRDSFSARFVCSRVFPPFYAVYPYSRKSQSGGETISSLKTVCRIAIS